MSPKMKSMTQEYLRVFLATSLALFLADGADIASLNLDNAKLYINAGFASVLPVIIRALNPKDGAFGKVRSIEE
jgi:hypothetical protein